MVSLASVIITKIELKFGIMIYEENDATTRYEVEEDNLVEEDEEVGDDESDESGDEDDEEDEDDDEEDEEEDDDEGENENEEEDGDGDGIEGEEGDEEEEDEDEGKEEENGNKEILAEINTDEGVAAESAPTDAVEVPATADVEEPIESFDDAEVQMGLEESAEMIPSSQEALEHEALIAQMEASGLERTYDEAHDDTNERV